MKHCCNAQFWIFFISNRTSTHPTRLSNVFVKDTFPSITISCVCSNEENASNIVIGIVQFLPSLHVILVVHLGSINGTHHSETINNVLFIIIQNKQCYNKHLFEFEFFRIREKKMPENVQKMCFIVNFKIPIHIFYGHHWIAHTQNHGYRHKNRDFSYTGAQVMTKNVISVAAILNVS